MICVSNPEEHWLRNSGGSTPASTPLVETFLATEGGTFIDIGCGFGRGAAELAKRGCQVVGVDINLGELHQAVQKESNRDDSSEMRALSQMVFVTARGDRLPFERETFDGSIMLGLLGGVTGLGAPKLRGDIVTETARVLKPGASLYIAEFARVTDPSAVDFYGKPWLEVYTDEEHLTGEEGTFTVRQPDGLTHFIAHHFTDEELKANLQKNGFTDIVVQNLMGRSALSGNLSPQLAVWGRKE